MPVSLASEFTSAFVALAFGFALGRCYHALFVLRVLLGVSAGGAIPARVADFHFPYLRLSLQKNRGTRARKILLFSFDFLFALFSGLAFAVLLYAVHDGVFRLFLAVAAALGTLLYFFTLGRPLARILGTAAYLLRVVFGYLFLAVRIPTALLVGFFFFCLRWCFSFLLFLCTRLLSPISSHRSLRAALRTQRTFLAACEGNL